MVFKVLPSLNLPDVGTLPDRDEMVMQASSEGKVAIAQLLDYVRRLERNSYGWRVAHLHLSGLKAHNRRDFHLRIAANEFDYLLRRQQGELFQLANGDLVYLWQGEGVADVDQVVLRLRYLFSDDPLVSSSERDIDEVEGGERLQAERPDGGAVKFCSWFDLERDYSELVFGIEQLVRAQDGRKPSEPLPGKPLEPGVLGRLEQTLATTDVAPLIKRQPICAVVPGYPPQPIFHEVYIAIGEMAKQLVPGVDLAADPWLFQRLAETLDRRLLNCLAQAANPGGAMSINLRLATLLSPDFLNFDQQFRQHSKIEVVIELQLVDIFAELGAFLFIRDFVRERGYRICIDGLHHLHMPLINRKRLGADLVKLMWSPDLLEEVSQQRHEELRAAIRSAGTDRVILCRCDSAAAVSWGETLGLRLFQGYYLDSRLRALRAPAVNAAREALRASRK